jgi:hypothetical protein
MGKGGTRFQTSNFVAESRKESAQRYTGVNRGNEAAGRGRTPASRNKAIKKAFCRIKSIAERGKDPLRIINVGKDPEPSPKTVEQHQGDGEEQLLMVRILFYMFFKNHISVVLEKFFIWWTFLG